MPEDSVSWRVFGNPVSLLIGGISAVLLELAEPRVRSGVWDHTSFRTDPLRRMRRTGLAAMVTVYGAGSTAEAMISGVRRMHGNVRGLTPGGVPYRADDPELLRWVHATAAFGFLQAYRTYVRPVSPADLDRYYGEGVAIASLYGAEDVPPTEAAMAACLHDMLPRLEPSEIIHEFIGIISRLPLFPPPLRFLNSAVIGAAIGLLPSEIRAALHLDRHPVVPAYRLGLLHSFGLAAEHLEMQGSPRRLASARLSRNFAK